MFDLRSKGLPAKLIENFLILLIHTQKQSWDEKISFLQSALSLF